MGEKAFLDVFPDIVLEEYEMELFSFAFVKKIASKKSENLIKVYIHWREKIKRKLQEI